MPSARTGTARKPRGNLAVPAAGVPVLHSTAEAVAAAEAYAQSAADGVIERDRAGAARPPAAELAQLDGSGLLGITVPRAFGGPELGAVALAAVIKAIAAVHFLFCVVLGRARRTRSTT